MAALTGRLEIIVIVALVVSAGVAAGAVFARSQHLRDLDDKRPAALDFTLTTIDGETYSLSDFKGRLVLIDMMATWCGSCRTMTPILKAIADEMGDNLVVLAIDLDLQETEDDLRAYRDEFGLDWRFALDSNGVVYGTYYPEGFPTHVLIDKDGGIVWQETGETTELEIRRQISGAL